MVDGETEEGLSLAEPDDLSSEYSSPSEREPLCIDARDARAAALAAADSSIVPVC